MYHDGVDIYRKGRGGRGCELTIYKQLQTNVTAEITQGTEGRKHFPRGPHVSHPCPNQYSVFISVENTEQLDVMFHIVLFFFSV